MRNLSSPRTDLTGLLPRARADRLRGRARSPRRRPTLFANLDTTFTALAERGRPFIQESISEGPPTLDTAIRDAAAAAAVPRQQRGAVHASCDPGVATLPAAAPVLADAFEVGTQALRASPRVQPAACRRLFDVAAGVRRRPAGRRSASQDLTDTAQSLSPTLAFFTPAQTVCNYLDAALPQRRQPAREGDANGTWQRFIDRRGAARVPNNEGGPSSAPANGGGPGSDPDNYLHTNPYPNTAAPGQPQRVRGGQRDLPRRQADDRQRARQPGHEDRDHEQTDDSVMAATPRRREPRMLRKDRSGREPPVVGIVVLLVVVIGPTSPSPRTCRSRSGLRVERGLPVGQRDPAELAGPHRRRRRRQGHARSSARPGTDTPSSRWRSTDDGLPIHKDATAEDPPAHLPRGQLLRRPQAGHARRAGARRRRHDPGHADRDAGAARPGAGRAAAGHAPRPADTAAGLRQCADGRADRRRGRRPGPDRARPDRRRRRSTSRSSYGAGGAARHGDRERGAPRHASPHDLSSSIKGSAEIVGGAGRHEQRSRT